MAPPRMQGNAQPLPALMLEGNTSKSSVRSSPFNTASMASDGKESLRVSVSNQPPVLVTRAHTPTVRAKDLLP